MYGKIFESLYRGSMVGAGSPMFAVWGYVIAHMRADVVVGAQVELNPALLAFILGDKREVIESVIQRLCDPDPASTSKEEEGRRLVRIGEFAYRVVNGPRYMSIRCAEERREYQREWQRMKRAEQKELLPHPDTMEKKPKHGFQKPTMEEAKFHAIKIGLPVTEVEAFMNYYESNGWRVGKNPMRAWHGAMANWKKNYDEKRYTNSGNSKHGFDRNKGTANEGHADRYANVPTANQ